MDDTNQKELHIKNMVCPRCVMVVRDVLEGAGLVVESVELGKAVVQGDDSINLQKIDVQLQEVGFALLKGKHQQLIERIKSVLLAYVSRLESENGLPKVSDYLTQKLHQNYSSLSSAFSKNEGTTIERYLIHLKIERVKELLSYDELTLSEIAFRLNYSSVAYLSNQFKKITDMSVTDYKKARDSFRKPLDGIEG